MESRDDEYNVMSNKNNNHKGQDIDIDVNVGSHSAEYSAEYIETTLTKDVVSLIGEESCSLRRRSPRPSDAPGQLLNLVSSPVTSEMSEKERGNEQSQQTIGASSSSSSVTLDRDRSYWYKLRGACQNPNEALYPFVPEEPEQEPEVDLTQYIHDYIYSDDVEPDEITEIGLSQFIRGYDCSGEEDREPEIVLTTSYSNDTSTLLQQASDVLDGIKDPASSPSSAASERSGYSNNASFDGDLANVNSNNTGSMPKSPGIRSSFQAPYRPPTKLHAICQEAQTVKDLSQARSTLLKLNLPRKEILGFAAVRDGQLRTPLHLLAENSDIPNDLVALDGSTHDKGASLLFPDLNATSVAAVILKPSSTFDDTADPTRVKAVQSFTVDFLVMANPSACMSRDKNGQIPFEATLADWVQHYHDEMLHSMGLRGKSNRRRDSFVHLSEAAPQAKAVVKALGQAAKRTSQLILSPPDRKNYTKQCDEPQQSEPPTSTAGRPPRTNPTAAQTARSKRKQDAIAKNVTRCFPLHVQLSNQVSFALKMLSKIVERLEALSLTTRGSPHQQQNSNSKNENSRNQASSFSSLPGRDSFDRVMEESFVSGTTSCAYDEIKNRIVDSVASVEGFVKMVLLIENEEEREFALSTTILQRVLLCKHSVGGWLTAMLQNSEKRVSSRGVCYLKRVSDLSAANESPNKNNASPNSSSSVLSQAGGCREDVHDEISYLQDFVPSLLALGEQGMEEAATSMVVRRVMDRLISRPFAVTVIFCDAFFLAILIGGFRSAVNTLLVRGDPNKVMQGIYIANTGIFYFIMREIAKAISLCMITQRARYYVRSFWNITDVCATILPLISVISIRATGSVEGGLDIIDNHGLRDLLALTTGFLWLRVLNMLKGINMQMATYILAILQITKDTLSFAIILFIMVITFGQMFYTVLIPDYCSDASQPVVEPELCVRNEYTFRVYTILLGDFQTFDRETFQTKFSLFLLVIYSFMVIIVLLNVLIALASDSYEKCLMKSQMLFGRARVMLVAELVCFQNLLRKTSDTDSFADGSTTTIGNSSQSNKVFDKWWAGRSCAKGWSRGSVLFFALSSLVILFWIIGEMLGYFSGERYGNVAVSMGSILINIVVFAAIMAFLSRGADSITLSASKRASNNGGLVQTNSSDSTESSTVRLPAFLRNLILRIMGSSQDNWSFNFIRSGRDPSRDQNEWRGRVHYLESRLEQMTKDSYTRSAKQLQSLEQLVAATEQRLKLEMAGVDQRVGGIKLDLLLEFKRSQEEVLQQILQSLPPKTPPTN